MCSAGHGFNSASNASLSPVPCRAMLTKLSIGVEGGPGSAWKRGSDSNLMEGESIGIDSADVVTTETTSWGRLSERGRWCRAALSDQHARQHAEDRRSVVAGSRI